jgi:hypothetical protein
MFDRGSARPVLLGRRDGVFKIDNRHISGDGYGLFESVWPRR